ncbi:MAG: hypothetical protein J6L60_01950 [Bacteroidaceae bacterium]|nr:hypothetical protein [Bacteroidaceae bacterium]
MKVFNDAYHADSAPVTDEDILRMTDCFHPEACRRLLAQYWPEDHPILINTLTASYYRWAQTRPVSDLDFYFDLATRGYIYERYRGGKSGHTRIEQELQKISDELQPQLEEKWQQQLRKILNSKNERTCTE